MDRLCVLGMQKKKETERGKDREAGMEEGSHRCGGASGDTSHYGVNCSSGDVVGRAERSPARGVSSNTCTHYTQVHTRTHMQAEEIERTSGYVPPA